MTTAAILEFRPKPGRWHLLPGLLASLALLGCEPIITPDALSEIELQSAGEAQRPAREEPDCTEGGVGTLQRLAESHAAAGRWADEAETLNDLGTCYQNLDQIPRALEGLRRAFELADRFNEDDLFRRVMSNLATANSSAGNHAEAIELFQRAVVLHRAAKDSQLTARTLSNLGLAYTSSGDFQQALAALGEAREYFEEAGQERALGRVLVKIGNVHLACGEPELARQHLALAMEASRLAGDVEALAYAGSRLANILRAAGDLEAARRQLQGNVEALRQLERPRLEAYAMVSLSQVLFAQGEAQEALGWAERGLALHQQIPNPWGETAAWDDVARARYAVGDVAGAMEASQHGIETLERQRSRIYGPDSRATFLASNAKTSATRLEILLSEHRRHPGKGFAERALAAHEGALARSLVEHLAANDGSVGAPPLLRSSFDLERLQRALDPDVRLIEFALGKDRGWAWTIGPEQVHLVELAERHRIDQAVAALLAKGTAPRPSPVLSEDALGTLAELIWEPLVEAIGPAHRLLFVPSGSLQRVPFAALPSLDGDPLVESFEVSAIPSAAVAVALAEQPRRNPVSTPVRILADPVYRPSDSRLAGAPARKGPGQVDRAATGLERLPRLRFSGREAEAVAEIVGPRATQELGFDATKAAVVALESHQIGILHIAAHTVLNDNDPEQSGIVFSLFDRQGRGQEGFLSLPEIHRLDLEAELVVLSACSTALGKELTGEGLLSLTRGFLAAGAAGVVASLWPVDDRATAELMEHFYAALWDAQHPAAALRAAQLQLASNERWGEPQYWAGFVYQGRLW